MSSTSTSKSTLMDGIEPGQSDRKQAAKPTRSSRNAVVSIVAVVLAVGLLAYVLITTLGAFANDPRAAAAYTRVMDSETGEYIEKFAFTGKRLTFPAQNPKTGRQTLYPAELCHWTKEGKAKLDPTPVILNQWLNKPGPTICSDCGRPVTKGNLMPPDHLMQAAWDASKK